MKIFLSLTFLFLMSNTIFAQAEKKDTVDAHQFFIQILPDNHLVKCGRFRELDTLQITKIFFTNSDSSFLWTVEDAQKLIDDRVHGNPLHYIHGFYAATPKLTQRTVLAFKKFFFEDEGNKVTDIVHLIWDSNKLSYKNSQQNIINSRAVLGDIIRLAAKDSPTKTINLLCHSMGNQFLLETIKGGFLTEKVVDKLILAAADFDIGDFDVYQNGLSFIANHVWVLYSKRDRILAVSRLKNKERRLGQRLPKQIDAEHFTFLDCSKMKIKHSIIAKLNKHTYFLASDEVRQEIHHVLNSKAKGY